MPSCDNQLKILVVEGRVKIKYNFWYEKKLGRWNCKDYLNNKLGTILYFYLDYIMRQSSTSLCDLGNYRTGGQERET